jgi:dsDNA-specific endonuclease/ATPase MutS2
MSDYLKILELDEIKEQLATYAVLERTKKMISDLIPLNDLVILNNLLDEVDEAVQITVRMQTVPIMFGSDMVEAIKRCGKGATLSSLELYDIVLLFDTIRACKRLLDNLIKEHLNCNHYMNTLTGWKSIMTLTRPSKKRLIKAGRFSMMRALILKPSV